MRIGELAGRAGLTAKTVRFYESIGVVDAPARTASGYRDYDEAVLDRLTFVRAAQALGLTLREIRSVLELRDRGDTPCAHVHDLLTARAEEVDRRIAELVTLRDELHRLTKRAAGFDPSACDQHTICRIIGPDDRKATHTGPSGMHPQLADGQGLVRDVPQHVRSRRLRTATDGPDLAPGTGRHRPHSR